MENKDGAQPTMCVCKFVCVCVCVCVMGKEVGMVEQTAL